MFAFDATEMERAAQPLPGVAREAIRAELEGRAPRPGIEPSGLLAEAAPVFVTLRAQGDLRGCIGSLVALHDDLIEETMDRARAAAFDDPRFDALTLAELDRTSIEVSILGPLEPVGSREELDPARFGIEVRDGRGRRGVLLPEIPGVDSVDKQVEVTREKAGIPIGATLGIRRFAVLKVGPD